MSGRRLARRLLWSALVLIVGLPLLLAATAYGLLGTEPGSRWLLEQARHQANTRVQGMELAWNRVEGTLLGALALHGFAFEQPDLQVGAERLALRWRPRALLDGHLHLEALTAEALTYRGRSPEAVRPEPPPAAPQLPDIELPLRVTLDRLAIDGARIEHDDLVYSAEALRLGLALAEGRLRIDGLELASEALALSGTLAIDTRAPHDLQLDLTGSGQAPEVGRVRARLRGGGPALQPDLDLQVSAPSELNLDARLDLRRPTPTFDLQARWPELAWPLSGEPDYRSLDGRLTLAGQPDDYRLTLTSALRGAELPDTGLDLSAQGDTGGLTLQPLALRLLDGRLTARGRVDWAPQVAWRLAVETEDLNPGAYPFPEPAAAPDLAGRLTAELNTEGRLRDGLPELSVDIQRLDGQLRDRPLSARGRLEMAPGPQGPRFLARDLRLASGRNRVSLDGRIDQSVDLAFEIEAPDLSELQLPPGAELAGTITGQGRLGGSLEQPTLQAKLAAKGLAYQDYRLDQLALDADWTEQGGRILLNALGADLGGNRVEQAELQLDGRPEDHRLAVSARAEALQLQLAAAGGWREPSWRGRLNELNLAGTPLGAWRLAEPTDLTVAAEGGELGDLCLRPVAAANRPKAGGQVCAGGAWRVDVPLDLTGRIEQLELRLLEPELPQELQIEGALDGRLRLTGRSTAPVAELELRPGDGRLRFTGADEPFEVAYRDARIDARYSEAGASANLQLSLGDNGRADGRITLGPAPQQRLDGAITARFPDLELIAGLVPALQSTEGRLDLGAEFAGTLEQPRISGELQIAGARARVPDAGIEITDIALNARGDGRGPLRLEGGARSGEGRIEFTGSVDPDSPGMPLDLAISGQDFRVAMLPEALVEVSPELRVRGARPYRVEGTLTVPTAHIAVKEIPASAVGVSPDEVIVGREAETQQTGVEAVEADVQVELGEQVSFKGFGLHTRLTGGVRARVDDQGTRLFGKINLVDATYKSYGQDLTVEQGRLIFAGPPANPELDLRALRVSRDGQVKAYLAMSGPLSKPRPRIYSEPTLPEAEALAYLLTGRGLDQAGKGEGLDIASAAVSYGIAQGEPLLQGMADRLGLDDLQVQGGENGLEGSSLLLGKYLRPDLYVGYTQGLFDDTAALLMRLQLTERVEVESRTGTSQSVDLFYRLEHD